MIAVEAFADAITTATPGVLFGNDAPLAYVNNPKSACTFAQSALFWANHGYPYLSPIALHSSRYAFWRLGGESGLDSPAALARLASLEPRVFTFVRHPMDRFVSGLVSKILSQSDASFADMRDDLTSRGGIDLSATCDLKKAALGFAGWLHGYRDRPFEINRHFRPQVFNVYPDGAPDTSFFAIDEVIKVEDGEAMQAFCATHCPGMDVAKDAYNKSERYTVDAFRSPELDAIVRDLFARDYAVFGY